MQKAQWLLISVAATIFGAVVWMQGARLSYAGDEKSAKDALLKIADLFAKKDVVAAKRLAAETAKTDDLDVVMALFKLRSKKGLGIGDKPGAVKPDGIEAMILDLDNKKLKPGVVKALKTNAADIERMAYITAAIAEVAIHKCPVEKKQKDKDPKDWKRWSEEMRDASLELAEAIKANKPKEIATAGQKLQGTCVSCHGPFRAD